jgi:hypothetical protein
VLSTRAFPRGGSSKLRYSENDPFLCARGGVPRLGEGAMITPCRKKIYVRNMTNPRGPGTHCADAAVLAFATEVHPKGGIEP